MKKIAKILREKETARTVAPRLEGAVKNARIKDKKIARRKS